MLAKCPRDSQCGGRASSEGWCESLLSSSRDPRSEEMRYVERWVNASSVRRQLAISVWPCSKMCGLEGNEKTSTTYQVGRQKGKRGKRGTHREVCLHDEAQMFRTAGGGYEGRYEGRVTV